MSPEKINTQDILYDQVKKTPYLDDHDQVFRSDGVFSPEIRSEYFGDKEYFSELSKEQKQRFFEKILADYFTRAIDPQKVNTKTVEKLEEDYDIFLQTKIAQYIPDYTKLESFSIDRGMLMMKIGGRNVRVNLIAEKTGDIDPRKVKLQESIQKNTDTLRETISTESYMGGTLIVTYENLSKPIKDSIAVAGITSVATYSAVGLAQIGGGLEGTKNLVNRVKRIGFRNQFGKMEFVIPNESSSLSKPDRVENHKKSILTELQNQGITMTVPGKSFGRSSLISLSRTKLSIVNLTYESFLKESGQVDSRELRKSFADWKTMCLSNINDIESTYAQSPERGRSLLSKFLLQGEGERSMGKISGRVVGAGMHWMFWPIFWKKYHANAQDSAMLYASLAETGLFMTGASMGARVPGVFKPIASILAGGMTVVGGEMLGGYIGLDKKWWKLYPDREDEAYKKSGKDGKSLIGNMLTMGELHAVVDKTDTDIRIGKREGWDIRIPELINAIPGMKNARDITLPNIDILRKSIDLNTPPWEWMGKTITRNKDRWNKEVEHYSETLRKDVINFMDQYDKGIGIFRAENIQRQVKAGEDQDTTKLRILNRRLDSLFPNGGEHGYNTDAQKQIIDYALQLVEEKDPKKMESISFFIDSLVHTKMYLENGTLVNQARFVRQGRDGILSKQDGEPSGGLLFEFANQFSDPSVRVYILSIFDRIRQKKRLVDISSFDQDLSKGKILEQGLNGYWVETPAFLGQKGKKWINTKEWIMFQSLLDDPSKIESPILSMIFGENMSKGDIFYRLLNMMVENKRQEEFVRNIVSTDMAQKWKLF